MDDMIDPRFDMSRDTNAGWFVGVGFELVLQWSDPLDSLKGVNVFWATGPSIRMIDGPLPLDVAAAKYGARAWDSIQNDI